MHLKINLQLFILMTLLVLACCKKKDTDDQNGTPPPPPPPQDSVYYRGMDLSFYPEIRDWQTEFFNAAGEQVDLIPFLAGKGVNLLRLRLWHTPNGEYNGLKSVVEMAKEGRANGMDIMLDLHYSDTWASPGAQTVPAAWAGLSMELLKDSVHNYTRKVLEVLRDEGALPSVVQVGNEINAGILWNHGRIGGSYNSNWPGFIQLLKSAITAIRDVEQDKNIRVMLHFAGTNGATWFFDNINQYLVDYDVIGLSYYSIWHGTNYTTWESKLFELAGRYDKEVMIAETGYPWTLSWNDWTNNIYGLDEQLIPGIPATPEGQAQFMERLNSTITGLGKKGIGWCYWAPDWVAFKGPQASDGSPWENVAAFDFENRALPVLEGLSGN